MIKISILGSEAIAYISWMPFWSVKSYLIGFSKYNFKILNIKISSTSSKSPTDFLKGTQDRSDAGWSTDTSFEASHKICELHISSHANRIVRGFCN